MRLDKYLKVSRIIKRRTVAKECIDKGLVFVNDKKAKASTEVKVGNIIYIYNVGKFRIIKIAEYATEEIAKTLFERIE